jgi:hypothetical protein
MCAQRCVRASILFLSRLHKIGNQHAQNEIPQESTKGHNLCSRAEMLAMAAACVALSTPVLRVCGSGTCAKNGSGRFLVAAAALAAGTPCKVVETGCLGPCRGVAIATDAKGKTYVDTSMEVLDAAALDVVAGAMADADLAVHPRMRAALAAKLAGDTALGSGDAAVAASKYTECIEGAPEGFLASAQEAMRAADTTRLPLLGLTGVQAAREAERLSPAAVRWLYEALLGRCAAQLQLQGAGGGAAGALADARTATEVCALDGRGWYRLREAGEAAGEAAAAERAVEELSRLGYSLEPGEEGQKAADAKRYDPWGRLIL